MVSSVQKYLMSMFMKLKRTELQKHREKKNPYLGNKDLLSGGVL